MKASGEKAPLPEDLAVWVCSQMNLTMSGKAGSLSSFSSSSLLSFLPLNGFSSTLYRADVASDDTSSLL